MTERKVIAVEEPEIPEIEHVGVSTVSVAKSEYVDPFSIVNDKIRALSGTDANAKRRLTTQINKFQRGDGASSVALDEKDVLTAYDAFGVVMPPHNLDYLVKLYEISAPHHASVDAKVSNIVGLGYKFVETRKTKQALEQIADNEKKTKTVVRGLDQHREDLIDTFESFNEEDTFTETLMKVWIDYETVGNGYLEVGRKRDGSIGYIGHVPAQTMRVRRVRDGFIQISSNKVQFFRNFGDQKTSSPVRSESSPNEIIHFKNASPVSSFYGVPDIVAAEHAIAGNEFAARFNLDYFENKAVPRHLITLKGASLGAQQEADLLGFFEAIRGQNHRSIYIPLPPDTPDSKVELNIEPIEAGVQDASFINYLKANNNAIFMVHRVPETKVSVGAQGTNLAVAKDADKTFKEQVCAPSQRIVEKKLNRIVKELTDAFEMKLNEMTLTDEDTASKIDERNVKAGIDLPNEVRARRGMPAVDGGSERVDLNAKDKIAQQTAEANAQRQRDSVRSANATDSSGGARNPKGEGRTTP